MSKTQTKKEIKKEFYLFDDIQQDSFVTRNNITYFLNGFYEEDVKEIKTTYVSVSYSGTIFIRRFDKNTIGVPFMDKLVKIIFDKENNSITFCGKEKKDGEDYTETESYDESDFLDMMETIPVILKEQGVHKFTKRKYGNKLYLNFK